MWSQLPERKVSKIFSVAVCVAPVAIKQSASAVDATISTPHIFPVATPKTIPAIHFAPTTILITSEAPEIHSEAAKILSVAEQFPFIGMGFSAAVVLAGLSL